MSSSSGMQAFTTYEEKSGYVATHGDSITEVKEMLNESEGCQTNVTKIHEATYLGRLI